MSDAKESVRELNFLVRERMTAIQAEHPDLRLRYVFFTAISDADGVDPTDPEDVVFTTDQSEAKNDLGFFAEYMAHLAGIDIKPPPHN
jgi:hypothetical protein